MVPNGTCGKLKLYRKTANASAKQGKSRNTAGFGRPTSGLADAAILYKKTKPFPLLGLGSAALFGMSRERVIALLGLG